MRYCFLMDVDDVRVEFDQDMIKKLLVYALNEGKTVEEAVDALEEELRNKVRRS